MIARRRKFLKLALLPRMDAYCRKDGTYTYRYKNLDGTYTKLGSDLAEAKRKALDILNGKPAGGTIAAALQTWFKTNSFKALAPRTQEDYEDYKTNVLRVFGRMAPTAIKPPHIARYLRVERASAPIVANKEMAMFSSFYQWLIDQGEAEANPCRQVRRNKETPRSVKPEKESILGILELARERGRGQRMAALIACVVAITGNRRQDVLSLTDFNAPDEGEGVRVTEKKRKQGEAERVRLTGWSDSLRDIIAEARTIRPAGCTYIFPNEKGMAYSDAGFKANWNRLNTEWRKQGGQVFTAHDLRAYFVTEKVERGEDPETHKNKATQTKIYDRRRVKKTSALDL